MTDCVNLMSERNETGNHINNVSIKDEGSKFNQFIAAISANICVMASGVLLAWASPILMMFLENPVSDQNPLGRPMTTGETSWIGALPTMGSMVSCLVAGYIADRWGRRAALLSSVVPATLSWTLTFIGTHIELLYTARFLAGNAIAFAFALVPMYIGEIAEPSIRGILSSFFQIFFNVGLLMVYIIAPLVSYKIYCVICAILPIIFFISFFKMPETPYYLSAKGHNVDVIKVLMKLRGKSREAIEKEANEIKTNVEQAYTNKSTIMDLFKVKANLKALLISCSLVIFQQLSGITVLIFYLKFIFASSGSISTSLQTVIVALIQLFSSCLNPLVVDTLGRRILFAASGIGSMLSLAVLGLFFYLKDVIQSDVSYLSCLPITSLIVFTVSYNIGLGPLPWTILGEIFSQEIKSKALTITILTCRLTALIVLKYFINIAEAFGLCTAFWFFGVICFLTIPFAIFILPETKGKSLKRIQDELNGIK